MLRNLALLGTLFVTLAAAQSRPAWDGAFTAAEAERGRAPYRESCARCHGQELAGGESSPPLAGAGFLGQWTGKSALDLLDRIRRTMPSDNPGGLGSRQYTDIVAYILSANRFHPGAGNHGTISGGAVKTATAGRTAEWRYYGGDAGSTKYSPLDQIDASNVGKLHIAWSWQARRISAGTAEFNWEATPLMVGGRLYTDGGHAARCRRARRRHRGDSVDVPAG
jgi:mono/diheme cytochrome c family protein